MAVGNCPSRSVGRGDGWDAYARGWAVPLRLQCFFWIGRKGQWRVARTRRTGRNEKQTAFPPVERQLALVARTAQDVTLMTNERCRATVGREN